MHAGALKLLDPRARESHAAIGRGAKAENHSRQEVSMLRIMALATSLFLAVALCAPVRAQATASAISATPAPCDFSSDRTVSSPFDSQVATLLKLQLTQYRLTTKQLPRLPKIYSVKVRARTAVLDVDKQDQTLPGGWMSVVPQANDFRYAAEWQRLYDTTYHTSGTCVRMMLMIRGGNAVSQWCWNDHGATCTR